MDDRVTDMTKGVYRRLYSGAIYGKRVNAVSPGAELLLWRVHMVADDLGNFPAEPVRLAAQAMPMRDSATPKRLTGWLSELITARLITTYESDGEQYGHVCGWLGMQPAGKNGRRIQKYPAPDGESGGIQVNPDESWTIQSPETETESESETHSHSHTESESETHSHSHTDTETSGQINSGDTSDSDSSDNPIARPVAKLQFFDAVKALLGSCGSGNGRHPAGSPQHTADYTVVMRWWDEIIWPDGRDPPECIERFEQVVELVRQAKAKRKPMAWLTTRMNASMKPKA